MNPFALLGWWKELLIALLVAAIGVQSYRLQGAQGKVAVFEERDAAQKREQAFRELQAIKNRERTDAQYDLDLRRARAVVVRPSDSPARIAAGPFADPRGGQESAGCISGRELYVGLAEIARRQADRASAVVAELAGRDGERSTRIAQKAESVAAAFRACQAFVLNRP